MSMISKLNKYYLCLRPRPIHLINIFFRDILSRNKEVIIYYIEPYNPTPSLEQRDRLISRIFGDKITVKHLFKEPLLMKNSFAGHMYLRTDTDRLYEIADKIDKDILESKDSPFNFLNKKLTAIQDNLKLYIKREVSFDLLYDIFLVELACSLFKNPDSALYGSDSSLLIDKRNYWSRFVFEYAQQEGIPFLSFNKFVLKKNKGVQLIFYTMLLFAEYARSFFIRKRPIAKKATKRIGIPYCIHRNFTEFFEKRNYYLFWYPESGIEPDRITIYTDGSADIPMEEKEKIDRLGFRIVSCNSFFKKGSNFISKYRCSFDAIKLFYAYVSHLISLLFCIRSRNSFEQWKILAVLFVKLPYWEDFFVSENIKIKFRFNDVFTHRDIAAHLAGAATISYNYSNHSSGGYGMISQDICDIYLIWGEKYKNCILNRHSNVRNIIYTGYIFDYTFQFFSKRARELRTGMAGNGKSFLIALMDESMTGPCAEDILSLYRLIFRYLVDNNGINLLIKPKKDSTRRVLEVSAQTSELLPLLEKSGRVKLLENSKYPVEAGMASDLTIGIFADSTAALECSLAGVPVIIYECFAPESDRPYYRDYKDKIIFYDFKTMTDAIQTYKTAKKSHACFADWSALLDKSDSFRDGMANRRIGFYIKRLLDRFDNGLTKDIAIREANRAYSDKFGSDKVVPIK